MAKDGLFGQMLVRKSEHVEDTTLQRHRLKKGRVPLQTIIFGTLGIIAYVFWGLYVSYQIQGSYFYNKYPLCQLKGDFAQVGDGVCDKWANNVECLFDGGKLK